MHQPQCLGCFATWLKSLSRYTLWNAEYRLSLGRNFNKYPVISEPSLEEEHSCQPNVEEGLYGDRFEEKVVTPETLEVPSPAALSYIQKLEAELAASEKVPYRQVLVNFLWVLFITLATTTFRGKHEDVKTKILEHLAAIEAYPRKVMPINCSCAILFCAKLMSPVSLFQRPQWYFLVIIWCKLCSDTSHWKIWICLILCQ